MTLDDLMQHDRQLTKYEYIRLETDMGDLTMLNRFSSVGWRVVSVIDGYALLERPLPRPKD